MSDASKTEETREGVSKTASSDGKTGINQLMPLIAILARQIASEYGGNRDGHANLCRWPGQLLFILAAAILYYLLGS